MPFDYDTSVKHEEIVSKFDAAKRDNKRLDGLSRFLFRFRFQTAIFLTYPKIWEEV